MRGRTSAFVYGNLTALATVAVADAGSTASGVAVVAVLATCAATFTAHVLADFVAQRIGDPDAAGAPALRDELRDAAPIATSGAAPAALLALGTLGALPPQLALALAGVILIVRLAATGPLVERLSGRPVSAVAVRAGGGLALLGVAVVCTRAALSS